MGSSEDCLLADYSGECTSYTYVSNIYQTPNISSGFAPSVRKNVKQSEKENVAPAMLFDIVVYLC